MGLLDSIPTWGVFIITAVITSLVLEVGFFLGRRREKGAQEERQASTGSIVGATLGLLAFVLAFTFGLAASRFQERLTLVLDDANAIETTYRRAGFLQEPQKTEIRNLIHQYVTIRLPHSDPKIFEVIEKQSGSFLEALWQQTLIVAETNPNSIMAGLFVQSMNVMIDLHSKRIVMAAKIRVPAVIWLALYLVTILAMAAVGYYAGLFRARSLPINFVMTIAFSGIIFLIADLDSPHRGFIKVSQAPMIDLFQRISSFEENLLKLE